MAVEEKEPITRTIQNYDKREAFGFWDSWEDYWDEIQEEYEKVPDSFATKRSMDTQSPTEDFEGSSSREELEGEITEFRAPEALDNLIDEVKELFATIQLNGAFDKDRFVATDLPIGIFDFSLASNGLYRLQEYYSPELDTIIEPKLVQKIQNNPPVFVYYKREAGEKKAYVLKQQQAGTHCLRQKAEYIEQLRKSGLPEGVAKKRAKEKFPRCKLEFRTNNKKVYLVRNSQLLSDEEKGVERYGDLFLPIGGLAYATPDQLMYAVLPSLLLAYFLNNTGIKTRLLGVDARVKSLWVLGSGNRNTNRFLNAFVIKDYDEGFDFNRIAILTADSRIYRWKLFKAISAFYNKYFKFDVGSGFGQNISGKALDETFERYKNWYIEEMGKGARIFNKNRRLMFISGIAPEDGESLESLKVRAIDEFFRVVDAIDLEFSGAGIALPRIKRRDLKRGIDASTLRSRLQGTIALATTYDESDSKYANTDEEIEKKKRLKDKLRKDVNTVLSTG